MPARDGDRSGLTRDAVEAGIEVLGLVKDLPIPGVGLGLTLLERGWRRRLERQADEFFTRVAVSLGAGDAHEAAHLISQEIDEPWAQDAVDAGFRAMMSAVSESGRRCVAALVAEYFIEKRPQDAWFQSVGRLLTGATEEDFPTLGAIAAGAAYVAPAEHTRYVFFNDAERQHWVAARTPGRGWLCSATGRSSERFFSTLDLIGRSGFPHGSGRRPYTYARGRAVLQFEKQEEPPFRLLWRCLAPVCELAPPLAPQWLDGLGAEEAD
jgi:hypothetical protein